MAKRLRVHTASTAVEVAGCSPATLRQWRNQNGLLPATRIDGKWTRFSVAEIAVVRVVHVLSELGLTAQIAVDAGMKMLPRLEKIFSAEGMEQLGPLVADVFALVRAHEKHAGVIVVSFVDGKQSLRQALKVANGAPCGLVDLQQLYAHVVLALASAKRETSEVLSKAETKRFVAAAIADAIDIDNLESSL